MVYATRGNRMVQIDESRIQSYVEQGYNIVGNRGEVLQSAVPTDINVLKQSYAQHVKEIEALKAKVASLETELAKANAPKPAKAPKAEKVEPVAEVKAEMSEAEIAKAEESLNRPKKSRASKSEK